MAQPLNTTPLSTKLPIAWVQRDIFCETFKKLPLIRIVPQHAVYESCIWVRSDSYSVGDGGQLRSLIVAESLQAFKRNVAASQLLPVVLF